MDSIVISDDAQSETTDREAFWLNHCELLSSSGLSRAEYCRRNNLSYVTIKYWINKFASTSSNDSKLVAVKIKPTTHSPTSATLCTLNLSQGRTMQIHDLNTLSFLLERLI